MAQFMGRISVHGTGIIAVYIYQSTIITSFDVLDGKVMFSGRHKIAARGAKT